MTLTQQYRKLLDAYEAAVGLGDAKAIGLLFSEDAIFLAPNQEALYGPDAFLAITLRR